ncbi:hypothetical protein WKW47_09750 [Staphylococcus nepalensis]|uniref:hypothetical protein n=1 Tax=Staphylococcus TaxID=1279 RepID=UPI00298105CD|nr:hypothetical protein [Staphylococcus equorum]MDW5471689.1 hypothetical protein [Staphylococcus equorum]
MKEIINFITTTDFLNMFIGSLITIITGTIVFALQSISRYIYKRQGSLNIYYKHVPSIINSQPMSRLKENENEFKTVVPLWIEFHNTKEIKQVIRNLNVIAFYKNKKVDTFIQTNEYGENRTPIANNGSYSFIIEENEIKNYELFFFLISEKSIDELKISYFDKHEKEKIFSLIKFDDEMKTGNQTLDNQWHKLRKK